MALADVIKEKGAKVVADRLGVSIQRLGNWADRGVPVEWCAPLERAVDGAWTRRDLRPDDWQRIWPELADPPPDSPPNPPPARAQPAAAAIETVAATS